MSSRKADSSSAPQVDDLQFDIQRLQKKVEMLQSENKILERELELSKGGTESSMAQKAQDFQAGISKELQENKVLVAKFKQKYSVINRHLALERAALQEVRQEMEKGHQSISKELIGKLFMMGNACIQLRKETDWIKQEAIQKAAALEDEHARITAHNNELLATIARLEEQEQHNADKYLNASKNLSSELSERESKYKAEINKLKDTLEKKKVKSKAIFDSNEELRGEVAACREELVASETNNKELAIKLENASLQYRELEKKNAAVSGELLKTNNQLSKDLESEKLVCERLQSELESWKLSFSGSAATLQKSETEKEQQKTEIEQLRAKLKDSGEKQTKYMDLNDKLQNDLNAILSREQMLRKEVGASNLDKTEVQKRLASISEKLRSIESDHASEIKELQVKLDSMEQQKLLQTTELQKYKVSAQEALEKASQVEMKYLTLVSESTKNKKLVEQHDEELKGWKVRAEKAERELGASHKLAEELRADRDDALNSSTALRTENTNLAAQVVKLEKDKEVMSNKLKSQPPSAVVSQLQESLTALQRKIQDKDDEIDGLKDTVRRECEERMEKMIEISELKDQLAGWARGGGGGRGATDAAHQTAVSYAANDHASYASASSAAAAVSSKLLASSDEILAGNGGGGDAAVGNASWALRMSRKEQNQNQFRNNSNRRK